jgi:small-conductance mechanosensitive channel
MNSAHTGREVLDSVAASLGTLLSNVLERWFGPRVKEPAIGEITWADLEIFAIFVVIILLAHSLAAYFLKCKKRAAARRPDSKSWHPHLFHAIGKPLYLLIWICGIYIALSPLLSKYASTDHENPLRHLVDKLFDVGVFVAVFWVFYRLTRVVEGALGAWTAKTKSKLDDLVVPMVGRALRIIVPIVGILIALPIIGLPAEYSSVVARGSSILMIVAAAWILFQIVRLGEQAVLTRYDIKAADNLQARKVYTQVHVLSRTLYVVIILFTAASILMLFQEVRRLGTSLLASAGVVGVVLGFAAQKTIANLFAGFQLAMTQPIRVDDVVIVEGEWGRVEEITLTYVVIHIWDDRRLIVPLSYFIEKPFQNWTRASAQLLGSVMLSVDYALPLDAVRQATKQIVESSPLWDKRFWNLQVTDTTERTMQLRVLATAADSSQAWDLRCEIREKLIAFVQKNYPQHLPLIRVDVGSIKTEPASIAQKIAPPS